MIIYHRMTWWKTRVHPIETPRLNQTKMGTVVTMQQNIPMQIITSNRNS
jgi:hypothetical protein